MIGRSLAMNSAGSVIANSARKIHSDQKPRRLRRKASSRRRVKGVTGKPRKRLPVAIPALAAASRNSVMTSAQRPRPASPRAEAIGGGGREEGGGEASFFGLARRRAAEMALDQGLGDLDGVEGGPFAQIVGDHPQFEPVRHRRIA